MHKPELIIHKNNLSAVILAGGRSSRMQGEDKGLILIENKPLISYVADALRPKVGRLLISANRHLDAYQQYGEVICDDLPDFQGPLAGIAKAMAKADTPYLLVLPCDAPWVNEALIERLIQGMTNVDVDICVADDGRYMHPTFALVKTHLSDNLLAFLKTGERKLGAWIEQNNTQKVDFSDKKTWLVNLNSPQDFNTVDFSDKKNGAG